MLVAGLSISGCKSQSKMEETSSSIQADITNLTVGFYNVENLFDTEDNPDKEDEQFLPSGDYAWTTDKYNRKLKQLTTAIAKMDHGGPELLGLAEVENARVVEDLLAMPEISGHKYKVVHEESPDMRGIDVAFAYDPKIFKYEAHEAREIYFPTEPEYTSRKILQIEGQVAGEKLFLFVNHWPSRYGGQLESESRRLTVAAELRKMIDAIIADDSDANIILMGDFNDDPFNKSLMSVIGAWGDPAKVDEDGFFNPMFSLHNPENQGTLTYQGKWNLFDQIIVSEDLLDNEGKLLYKDQSARIISEGLNVGFGRGASNPRRAIFRGEFDEEGFSDHFPVCVSIEVKPSR